MSLLSFKVIGNSGTGDGGLVFPFPALCLGGAVNAHCCPRNFKRIGNHTCLMSCHKMFAAHSFSMFLASLFDDVISFLN